MPTVHLLIGPVGAGKSTLARSLAQEHQALPLILDSWFTRLFSPDRPPEDVMTWYVERAERALAQIWQVTMDALKADTNVVLEVGLVRRIQREQFYGWVDAEAVDLRTYLVDAPRDVRRARVVQRNATKGETFSMHVPPEFFELASDLWESPDQAEVHERQIQFVDTA